MASSVRLGAKTLKVITGVGVSVSDVNDDMVMARGAPSCTAVHTTTDCVISRITALSCSGGGFGAWRSVVGGDGWVICQGAALADDVRNPCDDATRFYKLALTTHFTLRKTN